MFGNPRNSSSTGSRIEIAGGHVQRVELFVLPPVARVGDLGSPVTVRSRVCRFDVPALGYSSSVRLLRTIYQSRAWLVFDLQSKAGSGSNSIRDAVRHKLERSEKMHACARRLECIKSLSELCREPFGKTSAAAWRRILPGPCRPVRNSTMCRPISQQVRT